MSKAEQLMDAAETLASFVHPDRGWFSGDEGEEQDPAQFNHWTGAKDALERSIGRRLTAEEITVLSLSLCFGPTPALSDEERMAALAELWPTGNPCGHFLRPWELMGKMVYCHLS